jgi:hypothetical protein
VETEIKERKSRKSDSWACRENRERDSRVRKISLEIFILYILLGGLIYSKFTYYDDLCGIFV